MHRNVEIFLKAVKLMREGQEENAESDDDEDDEQGEDGDTTASRGKCFGHNEDDERHDE